jgi:hypothetical protein
MVKKKNTSNKIPSRLERWKKPEYLGVTYTFVDSKSEKEKKLSNDLHEVSLEFLKEQKIENKEPSILDLIKPCKEIIYDVKDGKPIFHCIAFSFNVGRAQFEVGHLFDISIVEATPDEQSDGIRQFLAIALFSEVPLVPNTEDLAEEVATHYRDLMVMGFTAPDEGGKRVRLMPVNSPGQKIETFEFLQKLPLNQPRFPAELALLKKAVQREIERFSNADRVLKMLSSAIEQLESHLNSTKRNESALQRCLTENPILFGLEYRRILPKHLLGAEYEMDYALERVSGLIDLVEIEASTHRLFNKNGDPTKDLVHSEQQVLDWLDWLEKHHAYAREKLPGLMRPRGYIVIGKSNNLTSDELNKLARRNLMWGETLQILTYNDVLERAMNMKNLLQGLSAA